MKLMSKGKSHSRNVIIGAVLRLGTSTRKKKRRTRKTVKMLRILALP